MVERATKAETTIVSHSGCGCWALVFRNGLLEF